MLISFRMFIHIHTHIHTHKSYPVETNVTLNFTIKSFNGK